ncbi:hypothetical protein [Kribbella sp. NPDC055071]
MKLKPGHQEITITMPASVPASATTVSLGIIAVHGTARTGYLTAYPTGTSKPAITYVNYAGGQVVNNLATVRLGAGRKVTIFNSAGAVDVVVDLHGYHNPPTTGPKGYLGWLTSFGGTPASYASTGLAPVLWQQPDPTHWQFVFPGVKSSVANVQFTVLGKTATFDCAVTPPDADIVQLGLLIAVSCTREPSGSNGFSIQLMN